MGDFGIRTTKVRIRSLDDPTLESGVARLRMHAYPQFPETRDVEFYSSAYRWLESHPLGDGLHRWVAVDDSDQVVGHLAATPQYYRINGQRVVAHTPCDYMVHSRHGFQALTLMRAFFRATENCVACDMVPAVIGVESRLGAEVAGQLQYAAKLLNVSRLPAPSMPSPVRRLLNLGGHTVTARGYSSRPEISGASEAEPLDVENAEEHVAPPLVRPRAPIPTPIKGLLNGGLRLVDEALGSVFGGGLSAEVIEEFDESFDELFEKVASGVPCVPEKDAAFLRWRYGPGSPQHPVTVLGVKGGETLLGYAVLMVTSTGQDGYVLDLTTLPERRDVAQALLRESVRFFRRAGVQIIRYRFAGSSTSPRPDDLRRLGFFFRKGRRNSLLVKFKDPEMHEPARDIAAWSYAVGDGEGSFWTR
ncbi:MAG: GNAT family N-acetyltransferase [Actinomycetota bacterium]|nr:GNAT family N-acetyltransferase [Actinomycetota bacterium]